MLTTEQAEKLAALVREYLNEMANPSPCATMRMDYRRRMAALVGVEDPHETLRRWHENTRKVKP